MSSSEASRRKAMDRALFLLKFRGRSEKEMAQRLRQKKFSPLLIQETIERLVELKLLNDRLLAQDWVNNARSSGRGDLFIRRKLQQRGFDRALVDDLLAEKSGSHAAAEEERAWAVLKRRAKTLKREDRRVVSRRLNDYLLRQGFSMDCVRSCMERYFLQLKEGEDTSEF